LPLQDPSAPDGKTLFDTIQFNCVGDDKLRACIPFKRLNEFKDGEHNRCRCTLERHRQGATAAKKQKNL
jgi:hypothetical protein